MYTLIKENIERVVSNETDKDRLIEKGFTLIVPKNSKECENASSDGATLILEEMDIEDLRSYAEEKGIDLGRTTSKNGIIEKINQSQL